MRTVLCLSLLTGCLALAGCSTFGKKSPAAGAGAQASSRPAAGIGQPASVKGDVAAQPAVATAPTAAIPVSAGTAMLAGQVIDASGGRPPLAYIQVIAAPEGNEPAGAPIDIEADKDGYFTIPGLQAGRHYQLIARAQERDGSHRVAGTAWATPPNPRLVIRVSEQFVTPSTPAIPAAPIYTPAPAPAAPAAPAAPPPSWPDRQPSAGGASGWVPVPPPQGWKTAPPGASGLGVPVPPPTQPAAAPRPEDIARGPLARNDPGRTINIPNPEGPAPAGPAAPAAGIPITYAPSVPTRVPSCVLTGQFLVNFALNDLEGHSWEFRKHPAKLTLVDFWETTCIPCNNAVPHLNILQQRYGPGGLQVVGIAYENGELADQVTKVNRVRQRLRMNYTLLLGGGDGGPCPVQTQFGVRAYPTLVLLDDTGRILWRSEGLGTKQLGELDAILRQRIGSR